MNITFLNAAGVVQFVRGDMESGRWREEEYSVNATFPYDPEKRIVFGMRMSFLDPATGVFQFFEVKNVTKIDPDAYQQIIAEHIVVSELSDDHINNTEITDKTPAQALTTVLTGTLWAVGNSTVSDVGSVDIARGSVWQAVNAIKQNYNCYIEPRVTVDAAGNITGRYLDITPTTGTFRGLRLSIRRNMSDSSVTYDDSETYTALYGYGGSVDVPQTGGQDTTEELTFKDVVWTATAEHPAKPAGQLYIEDPAKTALYGRNGRARFGYYQNSDIKDAEVLLAKTWEALKKTCNPKISITGTVTDLRRLGMPDVYVRLHDIAVVEIEDTGEKLEKQIIKNEVDLVDESANLPEIGDYIPNIIYINREEAEKSGGGGGGGGHGQSPRQHEDGEIYTEWKNLENKIGLVVGTYNGGYKVEAGEITLAINNQADDPQTLIKLAADVIDINGIVTKLISYDIECMDITADGNLDVAGSIDCDSLEVDNGIECGSLTVPDGDLIVGSNDASWQTYNARRVTLSSQYNYRYESSSGASYGTVYGRIVTGYSDTTLHYLGYTEATT